MVKFRMTQAERVLQALRDKPYTALELTSLLGIANVRARVSDLRAAGWLIEAIDDQFGDARLYLRGRMDETLWGFAK